MKSSFYQDKFVRNPFKASEQEIVRKCMFAIIGLGGTGGFVLENLARMGAENFILFDSDRFELSNFNRQMLATEQNIDRAKTEVALERARAINPNVKVKCMDRFDSKSGLYNTKIVIDGTDNIDSRIDIAKAANKRGIPYVFCSASGTRGMVSIFDEYKFEKAFRVKKNSEYQGICSTILCPAAALAGTLAASQAVNRMLKRPIMKAPKALFFDLNRGPIFWEAKLG